MAGLFQVLWRQADGTFKAAVPLTGTDGEPLIIHTASDDEVTQTICTRPTAVDWDGDGDLDLLVGNFAGTFYLFNGEGKGQFQSKPELILAGSETLKIDGAHSDPFPIDWDGDGDLDLLSGSSGGGVYIAENGAGGGKMPELKPFTMLIKPGLSREYGQILKEDELTGPTTSTRVYVDDVNADGKLDVLVGDSVTLISPLGGLSEEQFNQKRQEWQAAFAAASQELSAATDEKQRNEANQRYIRLYEQRREFMQEEMTGFVWLYVRK